MLCLSLYTFLNWGDLICCACVLSWQHHMRSCADIGCVSVLHNSKQLRNTMQYHIWNICHLHKIAFWNWPWNECAPFFDSEAGTHLLFWSLIQSTWSIGHNLFVYIYVYNFFRENGRWPVATLYCSFDADTLTDPLQSTGGHWPFSVHFSKMADQNLMAKSNSYMYRHDKMADQYRYPLFSSLPWPLDPLTPVSRRDLFGGANTGINFNKYEDIPVEASGEGCPKNIDKFSSCDFSEIIQGNIDMCVCVHVRRVWVCLFYVIDKRDKFNSLISC